MRDTMLPLVALPVTHVTPVSELIGSVNLVFVVQLVGFRRLRFGLGHVSGWFGSKTLVSIGNQYPMR